MVFSEQDLPGYKPKSFAWDKVDEEGNPSQIRSQLHEKNKRDQKRKENNGRYERYERKPIPKKTALAGTVVKELEAVPVMNAEYWEIEARQQSARLAAPAQPEAEIHVTEEALRDARSGIETTMATQAQRQAQYKVSDIAAAGNSADLCRPPRRRRNVNRTAGVLRCRKVS